MNAMRLALLVFLLASMVTSCGECPEAPSTDVVEPDWQPPTGPARPPTGGLPDELRPPR